MKTTSPVIIVELDPDSAATRAAERVAAIISERAGSGKDCIMALCGGTTPSELYRRLAAPPLAEKIPWRRVRVFFGDERDVPQDHVESNFRLVSRTLLDHVPIPLSNVHPMPADSSDLPAAAEEYEGLIRRNVPVEDNLPRFDLVLLGMGGDGHVGSLFPNTPALDETQRLVVTQHVPIIGRNRMTLTFPLINAARHVMFFVTGPDKAAAVGAVLSEDAEVRAKYPASRVAPTSGELIFVLDSAAAKNAPPNRP